MKKLFSIVLLTSSIYLPAQADLNARVNLEDQTDDCSLYKSLNGGTAIPEECKENDSKSVFSQKKPEPPQILILGKVSFNFNSAQLTKDSRNELLRIAKAMRNPVSNAQLYQIGGHTDQKGKAAYNLMLSQRRAESVRDYLISQGVAAQQLQAKGYGPTRLLVEQDPYHPSNRRVEIVNLTKQP